MSRVEEEEETEVKPTGVNTWEVFLCFVSRRKSRPVVVVMVVVAVTTLCVFS